ncbi:hypothetical protein AGR2A_Lc40014 [Agrobacterium genomosp. 2 str. CFBP 5494]|uniref:Uncharacterized protein n=1 Tax=Agrobacterium genomosp. 2 str. CFBP 5494 TaxID=1183436 RepID=A0A9W5B4G3_9HYPH|nr:hypothetical protein AGR2A_Lc40014 [Agrobacterium genomosp. 2 str. CFBP 5494]
MRTFRRVKEKRCHAITVERAADLAADVARLSDPDQHYLSAASDRLD